MLSWKRYLILNSKLFFCSYNLLKLCLKFGAVFEAAFELGAVFEFGAEFVFKTVFEFGSEYLSLKSCSGLSLKPCSNPNWMSKLSPISNGDWPTDRIDW